MAKVDVEQTVLRLQSIKTWLGDNRASFENAQISLDEFNVDTLETFQGETANSIRAYTQEVYKPIHMSFIKIEEEFQPVIDNIINDANNKFGLTGVVDTDYIEDWKVSFDQYALSLWDITDLTNETMRSISSEVDVELLDTTKLEEIHAATISHCQKTIEQINEFDIATNKSMESIEERIRRLQIMVQEVNTKAPSMNGYKAGDFKFDTLSKLTTVEQDKYDLLPQDLKNAVDAQPPILTLADIDVDNVDGLTYFTVNKIYYYQDYGGKPYKANFVFVEIDGKMQMFLSRTDVDGLSVPFGVFHPDPFTTQGIKSGWIDLTIDDKKGVDVNNDNKLLPSLVHYRTDPLPEGLKVSELEDIARYYTNSNNCKELGDAMLKYKGHKVDGMTSFNQSDLDILAGKYSGSSGSRNFYSEIEAHADFLVNKTFETNVAISGALIWEKKDSPEEYFNSVGMADIALEDTGSDKKVMDLLWGNQLVKGVVRSAGSGMDQIHNINKVVNPITIGMTSIVEGKSPLKVMGSGVVGIGMNPIHSLEGAVNIIQGSWNGIKGMFD